MLSFILKASVAMVVCLLFSTSAAFPLLHRDVQWSFDLYPTTYCNGTADPHAGSGSTGCRADLDSVASSYTLNTVDEGCRIEFFDNTMCDGNEISDVAGPLTSTDTCRVPNLKRRFGSYQVTCE
ncbi:hypothetical protein N7462_001350 [Penicillium macrosclerotiorum]|uniref:uncharacterized protein n=1 Tax=Penicillium macrosclerotiorum TaxID=303699 RepID=UPI0025473D0D|nr:uncharacterized protein N7462_001350 [Penicillium macrosclerotiorum]KAJ5691927.1 hypothetical protein N7462_001350 [Penicillium macrosclerotiorum]